MQARVKWVEGLTFLGESASGHQILMDGNSGDKAPSPMEMVLMAAGGCSAIDVVSILLKGRQDVVDCEVKLTSERREEAPRLFTHINLHFIITGRDLKDAAVARAVDLSAEKYCSVALMLEKAVNITHSYEVVAARFNYPIVKPDSILSGVIAKLLDFLSFHQSLHQRQHN